MSTSSDDRAERITRAVHELRGEGPGRSRAQLVNAAGRPVPLAAGPGGGIHATAAPVGRVIVAPGQSVDPDVWGNVCYDQTMMTFASAVARDQQWPAPNEGARCFLMDTHRSFLFRNGGWRADRTGWVVTYTGPASQIAGASGTLINPSVTVPGGRRYLYEATCYASTNSTPGGLPPRCWITHPGFLGGSDKFLWSYTSLPPAGTQMTGYAWGIVAAGAANSTWPSPIMVMGSAQVVPAGAAHLTITDIGPT